MSNAIIFTISIFDGLKRGDAVILSNVIFFIFATGISGGKPPPTPEVTSISPICSYARRGVNIKDSSFLFCPSKIPLSRLLAEITGIFELMSVIKFTFA